MAAELFTISPRATNANAAPLSGAVISFYLAGSLTSAPAYADYECTTEHGGTVTADSGGLFPPIYLPADTSYRAILKTAGGSTIEDLDPANSAYLSAITAAPSVEYYVSADDEIGDDGNAGTELSPFRTIQKAYDSLPRFLERQCVIWLEPGVHSGNYLAGNSDKSLMPRSAVLFCRGHYTGSRTQNNSGTLSGPVVIKSNGGTAADTFIEVTTGFDYGIYATGSIDIAIQGITIRTAVACAALLVVHRGAYVHTSDLSLLGNGYNVGYLAYSEARAAMLEYGGLAGVIDGGTAGVASATKGISTLAGGTAVISGTPLIKRCGQALYCEPGTYMKMLLSPSAHHTLADNTNTLAIYAEMGAVLNLRGASTTARVLFDAAVESYGAVVNCTFVDFLKSLTTDGGEWRMNTCGYDYQWSVYDTKIWLRNSNSYKQGSGTSLSTTTQPMRIEHGDKPYLEGTCVLLGNSSGKPQFKVTDWIATANGQVFDPDANCNIYFMRGDSASRTGCGISAANGWEGRVIEVFNRTTNTVTLASGVGATGLNNTNLEVGARNAAGVVRKASFVFTSGTWHGN